VWTQCTCFGSATDSWVSWVYIRPSFAVLKLPVLATVQCHLPIFACHSVGFLSCQEVTRISHAPQRVCRLAFCQCLAPATLSGSLLCLHAFVLKISLASSYPGRLFQVRVQLTDRVGPGPGSNVSELTARICFQGPHCWLAGAAIRRIRAEVGCEMTRANEALRFIFDTVQVLDPHPNISVSCPFMLNGVPVEFDVRLRQDRSIHLTTA
jgi:hypothetical protein